MQDLKIALVQMQAQLGKQEENLAKISLFVEKAAGLGVEIICFPEMSLTGYGRDMAETLALDLETSGVIGHLKDLADKSNMAILVGLAEKNLTSRPYITQLAVSPKGRVEKYRKTHLGKSEQPYFSAGEQIEVFDFLKAKLGIQICWDMHFPEMTTILSLKGAEIIFAPHASPSVVGDRRAIWLKYLSARAYDNSVYIAACNLVEDDGAGGHFCGGALVLDPKGNVLAEDFSGKESILVTELSGSSINVIREQKSRTMANSFYIKSRRPELYSDLLIKP